MGFPRIFWSGEVRPQMRVRACVLSVPPILLRIALMTMAAAAAFTFPQVLSQSGTLAKLHGARPP